MGLCGSSRCACGVTTDGTISISGSGESGDPYVLGVVPVGGLIYEGTASQAFTASEGPTNITIDTEVFDIGSVGGVGLATFTMPDDGLYSVYVDVIETTGSGTVQVKADVTTGIAPASPLSLGSTTTARQATNTVSLDASDVVTLTGEETASNTVTINVTVRIYRVA